MFYGREGVASLPASCIFRGGPGEKKVRETAMNAKKPLRGATFAILGDSYSTFDGWITPGNIFYYPQPQYVDDVLAVEDTWWHQMMTRQDMRLLINDSYSGSTVCTHVRDNQPDSSSFVWRSKEFFSNLESGKERPDYIFVFGGTNDSWLDRAVGQVRFEGRNEEDLRQILPSFCFVLEHMIRQNPGSVVVLVVNTDLKPEIAEGMIAAGKHYGAVNVVLADIDKQNGHPSKLGMTQIAQQVQAVLEKQ